MWYLSIFVLMSFSIDVSRETLNEKTSENVVSALIINPDERIPSFIFKYCFSYLSSEIAFSVV